MKEQELSNPKSFAINLLRWWKKNKRDFPWRRTRNPYELLVSEILLHRTRADQVNAIYINFFRRFPTIKAISRADIEDLKDILHPLGLSWRTESLQKMALEIMTKYEGEIPVRQMELESLPGVGHYIAAAFRCFCYGYPEVLLDTNTVRIIGRFFGIKITDSSRRSKRFRELYKSLIDKEHSRSYNYAMIDLGARICKPRNPICNLCPVNEKCKHNLNASY